MLETHLRQVATVLLESAIRIAPPDSREWARAIRSELSYVEGSWASVMWALGGASVMAKQALIALFLPDRRGVAPDGGLFAKDASLRKAALAGAAGCALASLLFFAAPPFRQAFQVALRPWYVLFRADPTSFQRRLNALAKRAGARHDPEGLAFCAIRVDDAREGARLVEEVVRLDRSLLWVYAVVGLRHPELPEVHQWLPRLEGTDAQNALFRLIEARAIDCAHFRCGSEWTPPTKEEDEAWQSAMAAAFESPKFDDYLDRLAELNRRVIPRYRFYDPYEVQSREQIDLPVWAFDDSERFAKLLLQSETLQAKGHRTAGRDKLWSVARFGQLIDSEARTNFEHWMGTSLQAMAYKQLQRSSERVGNQAEAAMFGYLAAKFDAIKGEHAGFPPEVAFGADTSRRNAAVVQISGLMILVFSGLILVTAAVLVVAGRNAMPAAQRSRPVATVVVLASAVGLLFSCVTLYLTYRPYWYIFQNAITSGGQSNTRDLAFLLMDTNLLPGVPRSVYMDVFLYSGSPTFLFYFWTGVTLFSVIGLLLILLRHLLGRPSSGGLHHSPRVP